MAKKKLSEGIKGFNEDKCRYLKILERYNDRELIDISKHSTSLAKNQQQLKYLNQEDIPDETIYIYIGGDIQ